MSHFVVIARLPSSVTIEGVPAALLELFTPYKEHDCGDPNPPGFEKYIKFTPTAETPERYAADTSSAFIDPAGVAHQKYDERFRVQPTDTFGNATYPCPDGWTEAEVPASTFYPNYDAWMREYHGMRDEDIVDGVYGSWRNPNQKWDWYSIGGRWLGMLPFRDHRGTSTGRAGLMGSTSGKKGVDVLRIDNLSWPTVLADRDESFVKWRDEYVRFCNGEDFKSFEGPRDNALAFGLVQCKNIEEITDEERGVSDVRATGARFLIKPWERQPARADVIRRLDADGLEKFRDGFLPGYCMVDKDGWMANAEMGWFGMSHTKEGAPSKVDFKRAMWDRLRTGDQRDWLVVVDCHI